MPAKKSYNKVMNAAEAQNFTGDLGLTGNAINHPKYNPIQKSAFGLIESAVPNMGGATLHND